MTSYTVFKSSLSEDETYLLYLLYRSGSTGISGRVRLQKMVFILKEGLKIPFGMTFTKRNFGPFSDSLMDLVTKLKSEGYVEEKMKGNEFDYTLTDEGCRFVESTVLNNVGKNMKGRIDSVIEPLSKTNVGNLTHLAYAILETKK